MVSDLTGLPVLIIAVFISTNVLISTEECKGFYSLFSVNYDFLVQKFKSSDNEEVKKAFIFACFAGLRLSDIRELTWAKIKTSPDGASQYVSPDRHTSIKTTQIYADVVMAKLQTAVNSADGIF